MAQSNYRSGPWVARKAPHGPVDVFDANDHDIVTIYGGEHKIETAHLIAAAPELLEALHEGRRAIGDHSAPSDCYATGPMTGDAYRDLVQCPACSFIAMYDAAIAKATGEATA